MAAVILLFFLFQISTLDGSAGRRAELGLHPPAQVITIFPLLLPAHRFLFAMIGGVLHHLRGRVQAWEDEGGGVG